MSNLTNKAIYAANQPGKLMGGCGLHLRLTQNRSNRWVHGLMFQGKRRMWALARLPRCRLLKRDQNKLLLRRALT